jgi:hypothetical protein
MKESYGKGVTNHTDLESCAVGREANLEALTKACTGQPSSRERLLQGADTVGGESGRPYRRSRNREGQPNPARSKNLSMYRNNLRENRESLCLSARCRADRVSKSKDVI